MGARPTKGEGSREKEVARRIAQKQLSGEANRALRLRRRFEADKRLATMYDAAARAGRAEDFVAAYEHVARRIKAEQLQYAFDRQHVYDLLLPLALSDAQFAQERAAATEAPLSPEQAREVANTNRVLTRSLVVRRADQHINKLAEVHHANTTRARGRRLRIDTTNPEADPLLADARGRLGKVEGLRDARNPLSMAALGVGRAWRRLGGRIKTSKVQTHEEQALQDLQEKYGITITFGDAKARRRAFSAAARGSRTARVAREALTAPARAGRHTLRGIGDALRVGREGLALKRRERRILRALEEAAAPQDKEVLTRELEHVRRTSPWAPLGVTSLWGYVRLLPKRWHLALAFMALSLVLTMGQAVGMATIEASTVLLVTGLNYLIALANVTLALSVGGLLTVGNVLLGLVSGFLGIFYDSLWTHALGPLAERLPDAGIQRVKPVLSLAGATFPQLAYWVSLVIPTFHEDGSRDYEVAFVPVDADGRPVADLQGSLRAWHWREPEGLRLPRLTIAYECPDDPDWARLSREPGFLGFEACRPIGGGSLTCLALGDLGRYNLILFDCRTPPSPHQEALTP